MENINENNIKQESENEKDETVESPDYTISETEEAEIVQFRDRNRK